MAQSSQPILLNSTSASTGTLTGGRLLFGRYALEQVLGRGGMGVVWKAHDIRLDRTVALKFLPDALAADAASRDELKRETRRSLELTHPNIVRIYDFVEDDEAASIAMEYIDGSTLSQLRVEREQRCFDAPELAPWVASLCAALEYAHYGACVVHRDLKPSNLMLNSRGVLKVADFGISCGLHHTAARVSVWSSSSGTLGYMSPQQMHGELAAASDDIYSLGATLYELFTSKPPFYSGDISLQIREVVPDSITLRRQKLGVTGAPIPSAWEEVVAACLAKDATVRPVDAVEIARRLGLEPGKTPQPAEALTIVRPLRVVPPPAPAISASPSSEQVPPTDRRGSKALGWIAVAIAAVLILTLAIFGRNGQPLRYVPKSSPILSSEEPPGGVLISTDPPGAEITVGAQAIGRSPASFPRIPSGKHAVTIRMAGYDPLTLEAAVASGQLADLGTIALQRSTGTLQLTTQPEDSLFSILSEDGTRLLRQGRTPVIVPALPTGRYLVRFEREGWPPHSGLVTLERNETSNSAWRFGSGRLRIASDPPGADVTLAGKSLGATPLEIELHAGKHSDLRVTRMDFESATVDAEVRDGEIATLPPITLKAMPPRIEIRSAPEGIPFRLFASAYETPDAIPVRSSATPALLEDLPTGAYRVVFGKPDRPVRSCVVQLGAQGTTTLDQSFPHGRVSIDSSPAGAEIFEDGTSLGRTPFELTLLSGLHELTAKFDKRPTQKRSLTVGEDQEHDVSFEFMRSSSTSARKPRKRNPKEDDSALSKIGRSLKTFFTSEKAKK